MRIRAYDKYQNQHLIIDLGDDEIYADRTSSHSSSANVRIEVSADDDYYKAHPDEHLEDPELKRWSDLTDVEIV